MGGHDSAVKMTFLKDWAFEVTTFAITGYVIDVAL